MNGVALAVALAVVGVDFNVQRAEDNKLEYVIQIEPEFLKLIAEGQEIHSDVPPDTGNVERVLIRVGTTAARHSQASIVEYRSLLLSAGRYASTNPARAGLDSTASIVWPAKTKPELSYHVKYGWQPGTGEVLNYYVQIDPTLLATLAVGDEIRAGIDPAAGSVGRFVIRAGSDDLPHIPLEPVAAPVTDSASSRNRFQPGAKSPARSLNDQYAGAGSAAFGPTPSTAAPIGRPAVPLPSTPDYSAGLVSPAQPEQPMYNPAPRGHAQAGNPSTQWATGFGTPAAEPANPNAYRPAPATTYGDTRFDRSNATIESPPVTQYGPPPGYAVRPNTEQQLPVATNYPQSNGYAPQNMPQERVANNTRATTTSGSGALAAPQITPNEAGKSAVAATTADKPWFTMVVAFALFMSIGGNLYLGWTAAEFHSRYRLATERLRSAGRG